METKRRLLFLMSILGERRNDEDQGRWKDRLDLYLSLSQSSGENNKKKKVAVFLRFFVFFNISFIGLFYLFLWIKLLDFWKMEYVFFFWWLKLKFSFKKWVLQSWFGGIIKYKKYWSLLKKLVKQLHFVFSYKCTIVSSSNVEKL